MNEIDILRMALAAIWTEAEKDVPNIEHIQQIADEGLDITKHKAKPKDLSSSETGLASWKEFIEGKS